MIQGHQPLRGNCQDSLESLVAASDGRLQLHLMQQWEADCNHLLTPAAFHSTGGSNRWYRSTT
jgi:hypothetical protein